MLTELCVLIAIGFENSLNYIFFDNDPFKGQFRN